MIPFKQRWYLEVSGVRQMRQRQLAGVQRPGGGVLPAAREASEGHPGVSA